MCVCMCMRTCVRGRFGDANGSRVCRSGRSGQQGSGSRDSLGAGGWSSEVRAVVGRQGVNKAGREQAARKRNLKQA